MRETDFIEKNKDKWKRYERALERDEQDPELLKQLYIHTTDDLSYSRTFYPNRSVRVYLNTLAQRTFLQIYRGRRGEAGRFFTFWTDELPRVVYNQRRSLLISLVTFVIAMLIGIISYRIDPGFAETIMGEAYMNMTQENIAKGDPMAVYKQTSPFSMSLRITLNNIMVALVTFVSGAFFAVGAIVQLIRNGVMLGVFQYFFYDQGIFQESFLTIWIHGALEISSIVIAGGAGLAMGRGLLFPGTLSRFEAFKESARDGLKIMLGTVPLFIIAGFLEGYLTRHTELPDAIRGLFILLCFAFILWYYVMYPRAVAARPFRPTTEALRTRDITEKKIRLGFIRNAGENMTDVFRILRQNTGLLFGGLAGITLLFTLFSFLFYNSAPSTRYVFDGEFWGDFHNAHELLTTFSRNRGLLYLLLVAGGLYGFLRLAFEVFWRASDIELLPANWRSEAFLYLVCLGISVSMAFGGEVAGLLAFLALPFALTFAYTGYSGQADIRQTFRFVYTNLVRSYDSFIMILIMAIPTMWLIDTAIGSLLFSFFDWVFYADAITIDNANVVLQSVLYFFLVGTLFVIWGVSFALNFYTLREIEQANSLLEEIEAFNTKRRLRGIELER
ncbi:stage II sporulation protein M [Neolewinella aurantiaca]|uniref:Stage II sporulation protein M n=1 Tax=Neolewinella aurantiaca TaxID=2602767 RepID=A0A5C7FGA2_9BACT|nr:stage II sporulation protein M [Neolewinella aurantiaca]TXF89977.1 stage II sporulation protein M [Neolewinella aurantiaca]